MMSYNIMAELQTNTKTNHFNYLFTHFADSLPWCTYLTILWTNYWWNVHHQITPIVHVFLRPNNLPAFHLTLKLSCIYRAIEERTPATHKHKNNNHRAQPWATVTANPIVWRTSKRIQWSNRLSGWTETNTPPKTMIT